MKHGWKTAGEIIPTVVNTLYRETIQQASESRVGRVWTKEDHEALCHHIAELNRTAAAMALAAQRV